MPEITDLQIQQRLEQFSAAGATCDLTRQHHENLARAYGKIISVVERDRSKAASRRGARPQGNER